MSDDIVFGQAFAKLNGERHDGVVGRRAAFDHDIAGERQGARKLAFYVGGKFRFIDRHEQIEFAVECGHPVREDLKRRAGRQVQVYRNGNAFNAYARRLVQQGVNVQRHEQHFIFAGAQRCLGRQGPVVLGLEHAQPQSHAVQAFLAQDTQRLAAGRDNAALLADGSGCQCGNATRARHISGDEAQARSGPPAIAAVDFLDGRQ
ncbi:hypothetical protein D3C87_1042710 [compost metagenome]